MFKKLRFHHNAACQIKVAIVYCAFSNLPKLILERQSTAPYLGSTVMLRNFIQLYGSLTWLKLTLLKFGVLDPNLEPRKNEQKFKFVSQI